MKYVLYGGLNIWRNYLSYRFNTTIDFHPNIMGDLRHESRGNLGNQDGNPREGSEDPGADGEEPWE